MGDQTDSGFQTALVTAIGPVEDGFASNLNLLTTPGGNAGEFKSPDWGETQADEFANTTGVTNVEYEEITIGERDGFVLSYAIETGNAVADGYQYYVAGQNLVYVLTVTVPEGGDRAVADEIGTSLRVT